MAHGKAEQERRLRFCHKRGITAWRRRSVEDRGQSISLDYEASASPAGFVCGNWVCIKASVNTRVRVRRLLCRCCAVVLPWSSLSPFRPKSRFLGAQLSSQGRLQVHALCTSLAIAMWMAFATSRPSVVALVALGQTPLRGWSNRMKNMDDCLP